MLCAFADCFDCDYSAINTFPTPIRICNLATDSDEIRYVGGDAVGVTREMAEMV